MEGLGITKPCALRFKGIKSYILSSSPGDKGLSDQVNLGSAFIQKLSSKGFRICRDIIETGTDLVIGQQ